MKRLVALVVVVLLVSTTQAALELTTADGNGADAWVRNDQGAQNSNYGSKTSMEFRQYDDGSNIRSRTPYLKFDVSGVTGGDLTGAQLSVENYKGGSSGTYVWSVYGLTDDATDDAWVEGSINYNNAPGLLPTSGNYAIDPAKLTLLGTMTYPGDPSGGGVKYIGFVTSNTTDLNLDSFLAADTDGLVTLVLIDEAISGKEFYLSTKERQAADANYTAPTLILPNAVPEPATMVLLGIGGLMAVRRKRA